MKKLIVGAIILFVLIALFIPARSSQNQETLFFEKIPGSKFHSPDGTWWGYNQSKIVRFENMVFMYVIENVDNSNKTLSNFVVYKKSDDASWEKGASFPTSRPGNILVDSQGVLHTFVFEPYNFESDPL